MNQPSDCCGVGDPRDLSVEQARERIAANLPSPAGVEQLPLRSAMGRVLAEAVISPLNVPGQDNSAMDGYAVRGADLPADGESCLQLIGTALAGGPSNQALEPGQCLRIMTGAVMPPGADSVIMQERVEREGEQVRIGPGHRSGENVRRAGEDIPRGAAVLPAGRRLRPADLGLLASLGLAEVRVRRQLRVAFFSTGDELRSIGQPLGPGDVYDSNRYTLHAMLSRLGVALLDLGVVPDRREALRRAFTDAAAIADVVITSGGVSVGEADYVKGILAELGEIRFWKIAMKPGRPLAFGRLGEAAFFGLPGNPVAVMVTFYQFVQPALRRLAGEPSAPPQRFRVPCLSSLKKRPGRTEFQRGILTPQADGSLAVSLTGKQGSGILSSMSRANCFIVLEPASEGIQPGDLVHVEAFEGLL
jgi:molybdopterin molybdotransferase